jgi:hypothetical protein
VLLLWGVQVSDIKNHTKKARAALIDDKLCGLRMEASKIKINNLSVQSYTKKETQILKHLPICGPCGTCV